MSTELYKKLRERLDKFPQGFPETKSGVEIDILKELFTAEEAEMMFHLRPHPEAVATIADRSGKDEKAVGEMLYQMSRKGLILRYKASPQEVYYFLTPWMIGIWEFQVNRLTPENIRLYEQFYEEGMVPLAKKKNVAGFRAIPIEKEIKESSEIEPFERVSAIIENQARFAVGECICRKESRMAGHGCDKLLEACLSFGPAADYLIENGCAREITKEEAKQVLAKAEEDGLIHFSSNHKGDKIFICNCCGCCCKALAHMNKYGNAKIIAQSNYYAVLDAETCTACETCVQRCQVSAIEMGEESATIDRTRCIGCGLCVSTCPTASIAMRRKDPEKQSPVYADNQEFMQALSEDLNKPLPFD